MLDCEDVAEVDKEAIGEFLDAIDSENPTHTIRNDNGENATGRIGPMTRTEHVHTSSGTAVGFRDRNRNDEISLGPVWF